jgi:hypothetical protein
MISSPTHELFLSGKLLQNLNPKGNTKLCNELKKLGLAEATINGGRKTQKNTGISPQTLEHKILISNLMIPNLGKRN